MAVFERRRYDVRDIRMAELVCDILQVSSLELLRPSDHVATRETDQHSEYHRLFYAHLDRVLPVYRKLVSVLLADDSDSLYVQRIPTFRVHARNSVAVGSWHRDRDFGHDTSEMNYWVPLTRAFGSNTLWIDDEPVTAEYGDVVIFDGANQRHGNVVNDSAISRVSMDFRTIPRSAYRPRDERTVSYGMKFVLGEYWDVL